MSDVEIKPLPFVIAHRGGDEVCLENTIEAFQDAFDQGVRRLETDVHYTHEGELLSVHGADFEGNVVDGDANNVYVHIAGRPVLIEAIKPNDRRAMATDGFYIPTMDELLDIGEAHWNIDAKHREAVEPLVRLLRSRKLFPHVTLASFDKESIIELRSRAPKRTSTALVQEELVALAFSQPDQELDLPSNSRAQIPTHFGAMNLIDQKLVDLAHSHNVAVDYWTINDPVEMNAIIDLGADGIFTDKIRLLQSILAARQV